MLVGASIIDRATPGWLKPPIVIIVEDIAKYASPITVQVVKLAGNLIWRIGGFWL